MLMLKPTTIIALDPHAAAFCAAARARLERDFGARGRLIQAHALMRDEGNGLRFVSPVEVADMSFDLQAARARGQQSVRAQEAAAMFERAAANLEGALSLALRAGRSVVEKEEAQRDGIRIADERVIYIILSSADGFASGVALELVRLIRWLFAKKFTGEPYTLHVLVLLPDLFVGHGPADYAATYALLKRLDHAAAAKIQLTPTQQVEPFDTCWLLDGRNAQAFEIGTLADNLTGYADAFAGFLAAEPERSGALAGTLTPRGKVAAYNSFGHGELFFPAEIAITRLSAALAADIIARAFLADDAPLTDNRRRLLLAAKQFVLSKDFENSLQSLERKEGALIWRDFNPQAEVSEETPQEYIAELQRRHTDFERESLISFRKTLLARHEQVKEELAGLLNAEVDRRADAAPGGLKEALQFLRLLTEPAIALEADLLGERPQNLLTERSAVEASLDGKIGVALDRTKTAGLLDAIHDRRLHLSTLRTNLRLAPLPADALAADGEARAGATLPDSAPSAGATRPPAPAGNAAESDTRGAEDEAVITGSEDAPPAVIGSGASAEREMFALTVEEDRQRLIEEIAATEQQLEALCEAYRRAVDEETRMADQLRREARRQALEAKAAAVAAGEEQLLSLGNQLRAARQTLAELREERREFLRRYLLFYPFSAATLIFGLPLLAALGDIGPARAVVDFFSRNAGRVSLYLLFFALLYLAGVFWKFATGINRRFKEAGEHVKTLSRSLTAAAHQLRRARNDQLRLEYDLSAQSVRADTLAHLIEHARRTADSLRDTLAALRAARDDFARLHEESVPPVSIMRRPAVSAADLDAYYQKIVPDAAPDADTFTREHVSRAQARRLAADEFRARLTEFARSRFNRLAQLSIEDVLLRENDLLSSADTLQRLRELSDISEPLLRLQPDTSNPNFAQRDTTLWVTAEERDKILELFNKIRPEASARAYEDQRTLRVLSRCLNFPAYFLGPIEHYRACYERAEEREADDLPDLLPVEGEVRRAHEQLLLALACGTVMRRANGDYAFANNQQQKLGSERRQIARSLATDFAFQKHYAALLAGLEQALSDPQHVYDKLTAWRAQVADLDGAERELLDGLTKKYHPLR